MSSTIKGLESFLPSIKLRNFVIEEDQEYVHLTMHLVAIDVIDKNGNLFWGADFDLSQYIKYSIFLNINGEEEEQEIYSTANKPTTRIQQMYEDMRTRGGSSASRDSALASMSPSEIVKHWVSNTENRDLESHQIPNEDLKSRYSSKIHPIAVNEGMDIFRPLNSITSEETDIKQALLRYETIDGQGRRIYKIPAVRTHRLSKEALTSLDYVSCYIFSIFDFDQLMEDKNINYLPLDIKDEIGSLLTYDLIIRGGRANNSGFVLKYFDDNGDLKTWRGPYHQYSMSNPRPEDKYVGFVGGIKPESDSDISGTKLVKRTARNTKVQDLRRFSPAVSLEDLENAASNFYNLNTTPTYLNASPEELQSKLDRKITFMDPRAASDGDRIENIVLPNFIGENPALAEQRFISYYINSEMMKYTQGNAPVSGKIFLEQTSENHVNYLFSVDIMDLYRKNSRFAKAFAEDGRDGIGNFIATSIRLYRRRVSDKMTGITSLGYRDYQVVDHEQIPYLVAETSQDENGVFSVQDVNTTETNGFSRDNPEVGGSSRGSTIRKIDLNIGDLNNIATFTGTDFDVSRTGAGTYQYYVEMDFVDKTYQDFFAKYRQMLGNISYLQNLHDNTDEMYLESEKKYDKSNDNYRSPRWEQFKNRYSTVNSPNGSGAKDNISRRINKSINLCNEITKFLYPDNPQYQIDNVTNAAQMLNPFMGACSPHNQMVFLNYMNQINLNFEKLLEVDNLPKYKYNTSIPQSATPAAAEQRKPDHIGNDTSDIGMINVTNYFPEYIRIDKSRSLFNLAYFGDIFENPETTYGIPVITPSQLNERISLSKRRFKLPENSRIVNKVVLEPRFFNSSLMNDTVPTGTPSDFHKEEQNPINYFDTDEDNITPSGIRNIQSMLYQSGMSDINSQSSEVAQRPVNIESLMRLDGLYGQQLDVDKVKKTFNDMFSESVKGFAQELGISIYTNDFPIPTSLMEGINDEDSSLQFTDEFASAAGIKEQKIFFLDRIKEHINSDMSISSDANTQRIYEKFSNLFSSMMLTDNSRYLNDAGIKTEKKVIEDLVAFLDDETGEVNSVPEQIVAYANNPNVTEDIETGVFVQDNYAPHSSIIFDSFKEIKILQTLNMGTNISGAKEEFRSLNISDINTVGSGMKLLALEQYVHENAGIGFTKISNAPVVTKYVLLKGE